MVGVKALHFSPMPVATFDHFCGRPAFTLDHVTGFGAQDVLNHGSDGLLS